MISYKAETSQHCVFVHEMYDVSIKLFVYLSIWSFWSLWLHTNNILYFQNFSYYDRPAY